MLVLYTYLTIQSLHVIFQLDCREQVSESERERERVREREREREEKKKRCL